MLRRYQQTVGHTFRVVDVVLVVSAWLASYWARFLNPIPVPSFLRVTKGFPSFSTYAELSPLVAILWAASLGMLGVYGARPLLGRMRERRLLFKAHAAALLMFIALTYFFDDYRYSRLVMLYFAVLALGGMLGVRFVVRALLRSCYARGLPPRKVLAIGEGDALEGMIQGLGRYPELGLRVIGVVTHEASNADAVCGKPILGRFGDVTEVIRHNAVDEVVIALPPSQSQELDRLLELLKDETLDIRLVPDMHRYVTLGCEIENFDGFPVVRLNDSPVAGWGALAKRVTDAMLSATLLVVLAPLLLLIAALVKLTSRGPVFYSQERMGLDGRSFRMFKFRSMRVDAESRTGAVWAHAGDDRRTAFGTFLRKTSLDELPQLWNVVCGDMSLVGPRPERPVFVQKFRSEIPHYMLRHKVRAGITGWAQVNGWRGNTSLDRRIECDLFYIRNWSYALDLKILTLTLWKGFIDKNAY
jgi:Undecaprenyl-phosphate glucose phosphotransferase